MNLLLIFIGIISIASICSLYSDFRKHRKILPQALLTTLLVVSGIGSASIYHPLEKHHSHNDVAQIKAEYKSEKDKTSELNEDDDNLAVSEEKAKKNRDKIELSYNKQKPQFEKEAKEKKEAEEKKHQEEEQKKKQEEQAQQQQVNQNQQQSQNSTQEATNGQIIWIAPNYGKRYHQYPDCRGLRNAGSKMQMTIDEAMAQGYTKCGFE